VPVRVSSCDYYSTALILLLVAHHFLSEKYKIYRFEQLVGSCRPRETYQLQHQLTTQYGQVNGFDLLEEFSPDISTLVLKNLTFSDLANCRVVRTLTKRDRK
jgi:hypothetical protein